MGCAAGANVVTDNLNYYVDAKNTKSYSGSSGYGGTNWVDLTGNNDVSLSGVFYSTDGYFVLDGTNDLISQVVTVGTAKTVSIWVRQSTGTTLGLLHRSDWRERVFQGSIVLIASNGTYLTLDYTDLVGDTDYNICYTIDGTAAKAYVNGDLAVTGTLASNMNTGSYTYYHGYQCSGSSCYYINGRVYAISYYDTALTADQIKANFIALRGRIGI